MIVFFLCHMLCLSTRKYFFNILPARLACHRFFAAQKSPSYRISSKKITILLLRRSGTCITSTCYLVHPCSPWRRSCGQKPSAQNKTSISTRTKNSYIPAMLPACKTFLLNSIFTTLVKHFSDISTNKVTCCFANTGCLMRRLGVCGHVPFFCTQKRALNVSAQFVLLVFFLLGHFSHCHTITQRVAWEWTWRGFM